MLRAFGTNLLAVLTSRELIAAFLGALFGFVFAAGWDLWKENRRHVLEGKRAVRLLRGEMIANVALLERARDYLTQDTELANADKGEIVVPLDYLSTRAWEAVSLAGDLTSRLGFYDELEKTYLAAALLNQRIQARELYRATNQAMMGYSKRRAIINRDMLKSVETLLERFREHLNRLPA